MRSPRMRVIALSPAEIPFHLSANLIPMDDEARLREMGRDMGEHGPRA
jgi:hypothetical protein